ncbi:DinB family protein [Silvibacterium sp.]|uniref:DinB family protein n=1 Tax=Silvibacterium sp. TaxID=1964179 RepID=UPI0039E271AB
MARWMIDRVTGMPAANAPLDAAKISGDERAWLLEHLHKVHATIADVVRRTGAADWSAQPCPASWSPAQIVEHTLLVEDEILAEVQAHLDGRPSPDWQAQTAGKDAVLRRYLPRIGKALANPRTSTFRGLSPDEVEPSLAESYRRFSSLLRISEERPMKAIVWLHGGMGGLSAYLWLLYIPLHSERHLHQLERAVSKFESRHRKKKDTL